MLLKIIELVSTHLNMYVFECVEVCRSVNLSHFMSSTEIVRLKCPVENVRSLLLRKNSLLCVICESNVSIAKEFRSSSSSISTIWEKSKKINFEFYIYYKLVLLSYEMDTCTMMLCFIHWKKNEILSHFF